jgi:hypothetical protein
MRHRSALRTDIAGFTAWSANQDKQSLPATPETWAAFIDAAGEVKAPATLLPSLIHAY